MASQCKRQQCTIDRRGFRQELDSWRHKLIHCVGFESILEGLFGPQLVEDLKLYKDSEPVAESDWSFDENCQFCCLRRDKVKEHLIGLSNKGFEDTPKPLLVKDQATISRLEKQAEEFLSAVLSRKDVPNLSDPHIPIVAREILQRMIRQFAAEYTSKTSSPQDNCSDSQPRIDQNLPTPPLLSGAPPSTSPVATLAGSAHNQNPVLSKLLMADQDAPLDLTIKKPVAEPTTQDGVLDLSIKKNRCSSSSSSSQPVRSPCLSPATSMHKGESPDLRVAKAKDLQSTSTLEQFMSKLCPHHQRQIVDAIGFLQTEVKALASSSTQKGFNSTSGIHGTSCSPSKSTGVTPEKTCPELKFPTESVPKSEVQDMPHSVSISCSVKKVLESAVSLNTSVSAGPALDLCSPGLGSDHAMVSPTTNPVDLENSHHSDHAPLKMKIMTSNIADGKKLSCVLNTSLSSHSDSLEERQGNSNLSNRTETHSARLSSSVKRHNQGSHIYQVRQKETLGNTKDTPAKLLSVHMAIPSDSPRTARKTIRASSNYQTRDSAFRGMADPDLGHCDIVFIDKPITECFKEQHRSMLPRRNARKSTRGHMYSDEIWELKTVRTLARRGNCPNPMPELITLVTPKQILSKPDGLPPFDKPFVAPCMKTMIQISPQETDDNVIPGTGDMVEVAASEVDIIVETSQTDQCQNKGPSPAPSPIRSSTENIETHIIMESERDTGGHTRMTTQCEESVVQASFEAEMDNPTELQEETSESTEKVKAEIVVEPMEKNTVVDDEPQLSSDTLHYSLSVLQQNSVSSSPSPENEMEENKREEMQEKQPQEPQNETQIKDNILEETEKSNTTDLEEDSMVKEPGMKTLEAVDTVMPLGAEDNDNDYDVSSKTLDALLKELPPWRRKRGTVVSLPKRLKQTEAVIVGYVNGRPISASDRSLRRRSSNSTTSPNKNAVNSTQNVSNKTCDLVDTITDNKPLTKAHKSIKLIENNSTVEQVTETNSTVEQVTETNSTVEQVTETNFAFEEVTVTNLAVEQVTETNSAVEQVTETNSAVEQATETNSAVEQATETNSAVEQVTENNSAVEQVTETNSAVEQSTETNSAVKQMTESNSVFEPATETNSAVKQMTESNSVFEPATETNSAVEQVTETNSAVEQVTETNSAVEPVTETNSAVEQATETNSAFQQATETNSVFELATETNSAVEQVTETNSAVEQATETNSAVEQVTETNSAVELATETNSAVEQVTETNSAVEQVTETNSAVEQATETNSVFELVTETNSAVEQVTETNSAVEQVTETNSAVEQVTETNSAVEQATETNSAVEQATEQSSRTSSSPTSKVPSRTKQNQKQKRVQRYPNKLSVLSDEPVDRRQSSESTRQLRSANQKAAGSPPTLNAVTSNSFSKSAAISNPLPMEQLPSPPLSSPLPDPSSRIKSSPPPPVEQYQQNTVTETTVELNMEKTQPLETTLEETQKNEVESRIQAKPKLRSTKNVDHGKNETQDLSGKVLSMLENQSPVKTEIQSQKALRSKHILKKEAAASDVLPQKPNVASLEDRPASGDDSSSSISDKPTRMPLRSEKTKTDMCHQFATQSPTAVDNKKLILRSQRLAAPSTSALAATGKQSDATSPIRIMPERIKAQAKPSPVSAESVLPHSSAISVITPRSEPPKQTVNKFFETLTGEESQHLITNLNIKYDKMQKGWVQMDKEGQPGTRYKSKADRQAAIWKSKRRTRKPKLSDHQKYSPVQMLFMKGFNLTSICRWFLESTETKSLVIVKKVNTRLPSETQLCFHSSSGASGTSQGVFPSLQAERLKKHLKKFAIASPVKSNPKSQKLIAKALEQEANAVKGKERREPSTTTQTLTKSHSSTQACIQIGELQKSSGKSRNPASARILRKYSNIREKMQVQQTNVRLKKVSKTLKKNLKSLGPTKSSARSSLKVQKSPLSVSKQIKKSAAKMERRKTLVGKKNVKHSVRESKINAQSSRPSRDETKKELPKRCSQRLGSSKILEHNSDGTSKSKVDNKKQTEAQKAEGEKLSVNKMTAAKIQTKELLQTTHTENKGTEKIAETPQLSVDLKVPTSPDQVLTRSQRKMEAALPLSGSPSSASKKASKSMTTQTASPKSVRKAKEHTMTRSETLKSPAKRRHGAASPRSATKRAQELSETPAKRTRTSLSK